MGGGKALKPAAAVPAQELSREQILKVLEDRAQHAQAELAGRTDAGDDVLGFLAEHGAVATRRAVAANPAAPAPANLRLADDADDEVRAELAHKIARLMPDLPSDERSTLRALTIKTLERLARDQETRVRAILAEGIKSLTCVPKHVIDVLAHDVETVVAGPILEYSPLLSDADLMEIIASARADAALEPIARRKPLSAAVADAIVGSLDIPAVAALLTNPNAVIRDATLDRIIEQARQVSVLQAPLTLRSDLSARAIRRIAGFVGADLIEQLSLRRGLDRETQAELKRELKARLDQAADNDNSGRDKAAAEIDAARKKGALGETFVEQAAEGGRGETVTLALAELARVPLPVVRRILKAGSARPITALVWRAGLSMRISFRIQTSVMHLPSNELLPARGGVGFPLSDDEMRWHLAYFDVAA